MRNLVPFKLKPDSVNLTAIGLLYAGAAMVQAWYWFNNLYLRHPDYVPSLVGGIGSGPTTLSRVLCAIGTMYLLIFWWVILRLFVNGFKLVALSMNKDVRIKQTRRHRVEMLKALAFLAVVLGIAFLFAPYTRSPNEQIEIMAIGLFGMLMAAYSMFANLKYQGRDT